MILGSLGAVAVVAGFIDPAWLWLFIPALIIEAVT